MANRYEWRNLWMHKEGVWLPLQATTEEQALRELESKMPYTEDGTLIRINGREILRFVPPSEPPMNFGPF